MQTSNERIVIGLTGKAGHGKNLTADLICKQFPEYYFKQIGFADKVKEVYSVITGEQVVDSLEWKNTFLPTWGMTRRQMLQKIGTDAMRDGLDKDVWVKALASSLEPDRNYIITDVRFPNEVLFIENELEGKVFRVRRPLFDSGTETHESETALDHVQFDEIWNGLGIEELEVQIAESSQVFEFIGSKNIPDSTINDKEFKVLMKSGVFVNVDLLNEGIFQGEYALVCHKHETMESLIQSYRQENKLSGKYRESFFVNLKRCELVTLKVDS